jgi:hypothetical protein
VSTDVFSDQRGEWRDTSRVGFIAFTGKKASAKPLPGCDEARVVPGRHPVAGWHPAEVQRGRPAVALPVDRDLDRLEALSVWRISLDLAEGGLEGCVGGLPQRPEARSGGVWVAVGHLLHVDAFEHRHPPAQVHRAGAGLANVVPAV